MTGQELMNVGMQNSLEICQIKFFPRNKDITNLSEVIDFGWRKKSASFSVQHDSLVFVNPQDPLPQLHAVQLKATARRVQE